MASTKRPLGGNLQPEEPKIKRSKSFIRPGTQCFAKYSGNGQWYEAVVVHAEPASNKDGGFSYLVRYPKYGNEEEHTRMGIMTKLEMVAYRKAMAKRDGTVILTTSTRRAWEDGVPTEQSGDYHRVTMKDGQVVSTAYHQGEKRKEPPLSEMLELGTICFGQFQVDKIWYPCEIIEIEKAPDVKEHPFRYLVKYSGYGNEEKLERAYIRMNIPEEQASQMAVEGGAQQAAAAANTASETMKKGEGEEEKAKEEEKQQQGGGAGSQQQGDSGTATSTSADAADALEEGEEQVDIEEQESFTVGDKVLFDSKLTSAGPSPCEVIAGSNDEESKGSSSSTMVLVKPINTRSGTNEFKAKVEHLVKLKKTPDDLSSLKKSDEVWVWLTEQKIMTAGVIFQPAAPDASKVKIMLPQLRQLKLIEAAHIFVRHGGGEGGGQGHGGIATSLCTRAGFMANKTDPTKRKRNQDRGIIIRNIAGLEDVDMFGVLDGHGDDGHEVSEYVKSLLPDILADLVKADKEQKFRVDPKPLIKEMISRVIAELKTVQANGKSQDKSKTPRFDVSTSGTTMCVSLRVGDVLHTANVGDSRAVLIRKVMRKKKKNEDGKEEGDGGMVGTLSSLPLSRDHKPTDPSERERIITSGGRCAKLGPNQPMRVLPRYADFPGLAVTRTVGDFWGEGIGLKAIPEFKSHELTSSDLFVVWASDGIWEWLSNSTVARILYRNLGEISKGGETLVEEARKMWDLKTNKAYHDDITCVVARFD